MEVMAAEAAAREIEEVAAEAAAGEVEEVAAEAAAWKNQKKTKWRTGLLSSVDTRQGVDDDQRMN